MHYQRHKRGVPLDGGAPRPAQTSLPCNVVGCERMRRARDLCDPHYKVWLKTGDPLVKPPRKKRPTGKGAGSLTADGYWVLHRPEHPNARADGRVMQHTVVMAEKIGRPLKQGEQVHHINGVRSDNRPENLELWRKAQPAGQRVADLIEFAKEILAEYGVDPAPYS